MANHETILLPLPQNGLLEWALATCCYNIHLKSLGTLARARNGSGAHCGGPSETAVALGCISGAWWPYVSKRSQFGNRVERALSERRFLR